MKTMKIAGLIGLLILAQTAVFCQKKNINFIRCSTLRSEYGQYSMDNASER
jgi:hypothetical protein